MTEKSKIDITKISTALQMIDSTTNYNGREGFALLDVEYLNNLGKQLERIVEIELKTK